jgi:hypothetical protein
MKSGDKSNNDKGKAARSGKNKTKDNLMDYTKQLTSLGALQQAIVRNIQKEVENIDW